MMKNDLRGVDTSVRGGLRLNESVSIILEASYYTAYFLVPSLDVVQTSP